MQAGIVSLWSLLEVARAGTGARAGAADQVAAWLQSRGGIELTIEHGALLLDGEVVMGGADSFAAVQGLRTLLRGLGVRAIALPAGLAPEVLRVWAHDLAEGRPPAAWPAGVRGELERAASSDFEPVACVDRRDRAGCDADSRLRAVFLQHSLIAGLPALVGVAPGAAKAIVEGIVDRLLRLPHGLEPLTLLQQDDGLLRRSTAVAVLATRFAHHAGWPPEQLAELGVAGLLHDIGVVVDSEAPGPAGFRWLLERGDDDCWLRSALVARRWREGGDSLGEASDLRGAVGLVRLAVAASAAADLAGCLRQLSAAAEGGAVPPELLAAAQDAIACA